MILHSYYGPIYPEIFADQIECVMQVTQNNNCIAHWLWSDKKAMRKHSGIMNETIAIWTIKAK